MRMTRKSSQKNHQKDEKISMDKSQKNALKLAIHALEDYRRRHYAAARSAAVYGFDFGINGEKHYKEYTDAIVIPVASRGNTNTGKGPERRTTTTPAVLKGQNVDCNCGICVCGHPTFDRSAVAPPPSLANLLFCFWRRAMHHFCHSDFHQQQKRRRYTLPPLGYAAESDSAACF